MQRALDLERDNCRSALDIGRRDGCGRRAIHQPTGEQSHRRRTTLSGSSIDVQQQQQSFTPKAQQNILTSSLSEDLCDVHCFCCLPLFERIPVGLARTVHDLFEFNCDLSSTWLTMLIFSNTMRMSTRLNNSQQERKTKPQRLLSSTYVSIHANDFEDFLQTNRNAGVRSGFMDSNIRSKIRVTRRLLSPAFLSRFSSARIDFLSHSRHEHRLSAEVRGGQNSRVRSCHSRTTRAGRQPSTSCRRIDRATRASTIHASAIVLCHPRGLLSQISRGFERFGRFMTSGVCRLDDPHEDMFTHRRRTQPVESSPWRGAKR